MILTDAGPIIALFDRGEPDHARCRAALSNLVGPMVTTWPAFTEAMYLLAEAGGWPAQQGLWTLVERRDLLVEAPIDLNRVRELMEKYKDRPMDLADATLVALAEERRLTTIFTLDGDFRIYRLPHGRSFRVIP